MAKRCCTGVSARSATTSRETSLEVCERLQRYCVDGSQWQLPLILQHCVTDDGADEVQPSSQLLERGGASCRVAAAHATASTLSAGSCEVGNFDASALPALAHSPRKKPYNCTKTQLQQGSACCHWFGWGFDTSGPRRLLLPVRGLSGATCPPHDCSFWTLLQGLWAEARHNDATVKP